MNIDFMCNGCGHEFGADDKAPKRCPNCGSSYLIRIPMRMPDEGFQSCVFDEQRSER